MRRDPLRALREANPHSRELPAPEFDRLRDRILRGSDPQASDAGIPNPGAKRRRLLIGGAGSVLVVTLAVLITVGALLLAGHTRPHAGRPLSSTALAGLPAVPVVDASTARAFEYFKRAEQRTEADDPACRNVRTRVMRGPATGAPDRLLLRSFSVLELPSSPRPAELPANGAFGQVLRGYARVVKPPTGPDVVVFPVKEISSGGALGSAHCVEQTGKALLSTVHNAPAATRATARRIGRELVADNLYALRHRNAGICLSDDQGARACTNLLYAATRGILLSVANRQTYLVPDGVSTVETQYGSGHVTAVRAHVIDNLAEWQIANTANDTTPERITWRAADGHIIRTVTQQPIEVAP